MKFVGSSVYLFFGGEGQVGRSNLGMGINMENFD